MGAGHDHSHATGWGTEYPLSKLVQPEDLAYFLQFTGPDQELYNLQGSPLLLDDRWVKMPDGEYRLSQNYKAQDYLNPSSYGEYSENRFIPLGDYLNILAANKDIDNVDDFLIDATSRMRDANNYPIDLFDESNFHTLETLVDTYNPYGNVNEYTDVNTELLQRPFSGFFRQYANEPGIEALRYYMGQENPQPFYDISLEEFQPYRGEESIDRKFAPSWDDLDEYDEAGDTLGRFNSEESDQIGIYDINLRNRKNKAKHTAMHELMHFLEKNYGMAGYMDQPNRYNQFPDSSGDNVNWHRMMKRGYDAHDIIYGIDKLTRQSNHPLYRKYLSGSISPDNFNAIQNTYNASKAANIKDNYQIVNKPKLANISDFPIRSDISYDYKPPGTTYGPAGMGGFNSGGIASLVI
tara:strand:- start:34 stop:1257 length:1224 start_codon:yes stop_codon:yes gene_type:complete